MCISAVSTISPGAAGPISARCPRALKKKSCRAIDTNFIIKLANVGLSCCGKSWLAEW